MLAEAIGGIFLLPGIGWMYAGNLLRGGMLLVLSLLGTLPIVIEIATPTAGLGLCCCLPPIYIGLILDVLALNHWIDHPTPYTWRNVLIETLISFLLLLLLVAADVWVIVRVIELLQERSLPWFAP